MLFLLAVCALAGSALLLLAKTKPLYNQDFLDTLGIDGDIRITRAPSGAPTVSAETLRDALFGQGLIHAQDRLSQLVLERAASRGEVSAIIGKAGIAHDTMARTYNFNSTAYAMCDGLSSHHRSLMESYVSGINTYLRNNPILPPDMYLYAKRLLVPEEVEPWTIYDLCRSMAQYQTQLSSNCESEVRRWNTFWEAKSDVPYDVVEKLFPAQRHFRDDEALQYSTILRDDDLRGPFGPSGVRMDAKERNREEDETFQIERNVYSKLFRDRRFKSLQHNLKRKDLSRRFIPSMGVKLWLEHDFELFEEGGLRGSNAWAVSSPEIEGPIVANDPHLDMYLPGPWHFATLQIRSTGEWYTGATHVGLPGISVGSSKYLSWGMTLALTDLCDLFIIERDASRPKSHYLHNGVSKPFRVRSEKIHVRGGQSIPITVRETIYGPMLDNYKNTKVHSLAVWNAASQAEYASKSLESFLNFVSGLRTVEELRDKVLHGIAAPALSIVMADHTGAIGYAVTGIHPHRQKGHTGRYPIPGNGKFDHIGIIPMINLPWKITPKSADLRNFVVAGNNKIYPDSYKYRLGYEFSSNHRSVRIGEMLEHLDTVSMDSIKEIQLDALSNVWTRSFRPWLKKQIKLRQEIPELDRMFSEWDGEITPDNLFAPILWEYMSLVIDKFKDTYSAKKIRHVDPLVAYYISVDHANAHIIKIAWEEAFSKNLGPWGSDWGHMTLPHFFLANTPLRFASNRYPSKAGGDYTSVNMIGGRKSSQPNSRHFGPSLRMVMETPGVISYAIPGGFSENPFSPFYANLVESWSSGNFTDTTPTSLPSKGLEQRIQKKVQVS